ncbi:hypothetical protein GLOIN_2v1871822 [Rhizophagus clarus]|uniref:Ion transport domain-containing protein n=1 Tax=Rhizophagus clarus TaxID=94130 RepID=A0A8H3LWP5_9GLOM|nr:hypothetical protein GLOIN_2v1871822 [Rhizophagus clarus]
MIIKLSFKFIIIYIFLLLLSFPCLSNNNLTYNENDIVIGYTTIGTFSDGTILFQVIFENTPSYTNLSLIYPDGTLNFINNISIPCNSCMNSDDDIYVSCLCMNKIYLLNPNYIIITYVQVGELMGLIIDRKGIVITSNFILGEAFSIYRIVSEDDGGRFFVVRQIVETPEQLLCAEYLVNSNGQISNIISGNLTFNNIDGIIIDNIITFDAFSLDGTWAIVFQVIFSNQDNQHDNSYFSIGDDSNQELYVFKTLRLFGITSYLQASVCVANKGISIQYHCLFINYDSKLKLINIIDLNSNNTSSIDLIAFTINQYNVIYAIPDTGFLIETTSNLQLDYFVLNTSIDYSDTNNAFGELITDNYYINDSDLSYNHLFILPNNTIIQMLANEGSFTFLSTDLSSKIPKDEPYKNTHINKVYPSQNDLISIGTTALNMSFVHSIDPTTGSNISIYQQHNEENFLRQIFLCTSPNCVISEDFSSLAINLLTITFNIPNSSYYVEIDDNFVKYKYDGPKTIIPGIKPGNWIIKTSSEYNPINDNTDYITGILRLNLEGTTEFKKLKNTNEKKNFFDQMRIELSKSIPVDLSRIRKIKDIFGIDKISNLELLLILFEIGPSDDNCFNNKSSIDVFNDLDSIIKVKNITMPLDIYDHTKYIDKDYGFQRTADLWEEIRISLKSFASNVSYLVIISVLVFSSIVLFIYGKYKDRKQEMENMTIFKITLIIIDVINDVSFIISSKNDLHNLLIPSSGDVELLHLFDSKFGGYDIFKINFSQYSKDLITWGSYLNIILEDLPQLIIQILFALNSTNSYSIIAFITLITSSVVMLVDIVEGGFTIYAEVFHDKGNKTNNNRERDTR